MIVEQRIYTLTVGTTPQYFANYEKAGLAVQTKILGNLVGYYRTEVGPLNQVIHMWGYTSFEERDKRRIALFQDLEWLEYLKLNRQFIVKQETKIMVPAPFCPSRKMIK